MLPLWFKGFSGETLKCDMGNANMIGSRPKKIEPRKLCTRKNDKKTHRYTLDGGFRRLLQLRLRFPKKMITKIDQNHDFSKIRFGTPNPQNMVVFLHFFHQIKTSQCGCVGLGNFMAEFFQVPS